MRESAITLASELTQNELTVLKELLQSKKLSGTHLEIGTAAGGTLCELMMAYAENERPGFVVVDPMFYFPNQLETVKRNLSNHQLNPNSVDFRIGRGADLFPVAEDQKDQFDFIFIDGNHKIKYVNQDIKWARLLNVGGFLCFHDFDNRSKGVVFSVKKLLKKYKNYSIYKQTESLIILEKKSESKHKEVSSLDTFIAFILNIYFKIEKQINPPKEIKYP